ncbi:penicillin-binding protein 2 [Methylophilaceae bacterium]|nr:penicillin-binding protein 2 [Methylophilaceae bacterium]
MDQHKFKYFFTRRLNFLFGIFIFIFAILLIKIFYLQVIKFEDYSSLAQNNSLKIVPIPPIRGQILDVNGEILAENKLVYTLELDPKKNTDLKIVKQQLTNIVKITKYDLKKYSKTLSESHYSTTLPIKSNLTDVQVAKFVANKYKYPEIFLKHKFARSYPKEKSGAHFIGYLNRINKKDIKKLKKLKQYENYIGTDHIGKTGVEYFYENRLHGQPGYKALEVDAHNKVIRVIETVEPIHGEDITLNIDYKLQQVAEKAFGKYKGAMVALNPNNGAVLAYVSQPSFNSNLFINGIDETNWKRLNDSNHKPLINRVVSGLYPPGSTLKPFVALAALENNIRRPPFSIIDKGFYTMPNQSKTFKDWKKGGHGEVDLIKAIAVSCDTFFYGLGVELGIPKLNIVLKRFGFGEKTNIDIPNEKSGLIASVEWKKEKYNKKWYQGETAITAIGQGYTLTTPIQLALATAKLINSDNNLRPHMLKKFNAPDFMYEDEINLSGNDTDNLNLIKEGMSLVTKEGGTAAFIGRTTSYDISAKTGTAQVFGLKKGEIYDETKLPDKLKDHALFIAFAPSKNPRLVMAIVVENGGHGGSTAGPIAKKIFDAYLNEIK